MCSSLSPASAAVPAVHSYSCKGLSATEKMAKQLRYARLFQVRFGDNKCEEREFKIPVPRELIPEQSRPFDWTVAQHIGSKPKQEDGFLPKMTFVIDWHHEPIPVTMFGVFDGHGDSGNVSRFLNEHLTSYLSDAFTLKEPSNLGPLTDDIIGDVLVDVFASLAQRYQREEGGVGGATVVLLLRIKEALYIANAGDSRAILIKPEAEHLLTEDAHLDNHRFSRWHVKRGNHIGYAEGEYDLLRVFNKDKTQGGLMLSRDIGCYPWMQSKPKITKVLLGEVKDRPGESILHCKTGDVLLLATDGLFEPANIREASRVVRTHYAARVPIQQIASALVDKAGGYKRNDNVTAMLITI